MPFEKIFIQCNQADIQALLFIYGLVILTEFYDYMAKIENFLL